MSKKTKKYIFSTIYLTVPKWYYTIVAAQENLVTLEETQIRGEKLLNKAGYGFNSNNKISRIDNFDTVDWLSNFERI